MTESDKADVIGRRKCYKAGSTFPPPKKGLLRVYNGRFCSYAHRVRLLLAYLNIPHELINIDLDNKPGWFFEKNPQGLVPVIELDGHVMCESVDCCEYLDKNYNGGRLSHQDKDKNVRDKRLIEKYYKVTGPYYGALFSLGESHIELDRFHEGLKVYETELKDRGGTYFGGDTPMLIDFILWPHMERISVIHKLFPKMGLTADKFPYLHSWVQRMRSVPAVIKAMIPDHLHVEFLKQYANGTPDYDLGLN